jgi:hypothetical protein
MKVMQKLAVYAKTRIAFGVYVPYLLFHSSWKICLDIEEIWHTTSLK